MESAHRNARESVARRKARPFISGRNREKVRLPIAGRDAAIRIDEDLRIVDNLVGAFGNAADNNERKFLRHFLERWNGTFRPRLRLRLNHRH